jgi:hypothetical protein
VSDDCAVIDVESNDQDLAILALDVDACTSVEWLEVVLE